MSICIIDESVIDRLLPEAEVLFKSAHADTKMSVLVTFILLKKKKKGGEKVHINI